MGYERNPTTVEPAAGPAPVATAPERICVVLPGLGAGGTEHVVSVLANEWIARGRSVTILTLEEPGAVPYYPLHPDIEVRRLGVPPGRRGAIGAAGAVGMRVRRLRGALRAVRPGIVVSFLVRTNVLTLIAASRLGMEVVVSERNNPQAQTVGPVWNVLRSHLYRRAFGLVTMTKGALESFPASMRKRGWVIPNPVDLPGAGRRRSDGRTLTAVGRLVPQKGFDLLLRAFAEVAPEFPDWRLVIWGEGADREVLEAERAALGLDDRVDMPGVTEAPGIWVDTADAFVLSSRFEGWGIVLLEAMAAGLPVVSFDCRWGPREMIEDGENGLLVEPESVAAMAEALRRLLGDSSLRQRLAAAACASSRRFTTAHVVDRWDEVVDAALAVRPLSRFLR